MMHRHGAQIAALLLIAASTWISGCTKSEPLRQEPSASPRAAQHPVLVFITDFGTANDAVAICKAVMLNIAPDLRIMDITHQVTPYSIEEGARFLAGVSPYYPAGTVFVGVIDPGVGTNRKAVVVKTKKGQYFVVPDNGLISPVIDRDGLDSAREIINSSWMIGDAISSTFHGRDIFSPVGAHLAAGWDYTLVGPTVQQLVRLTPKTPAVTDKGIEGDIIALDDPFGSLITDISGDEFKQLGYNLGDRVTIQLNKKPFSLPYMKTFMDVPVGDPLLYVDSRGRIGIALNQRNFSVTNKIAPPATLFIPKKGLPIHGK
ncbi:MAG TPA: SAM-dependent chlorinase/fluorinase [Candidatus Eisenbacteria bacterium]|nr:SAM-dependent chlorinase/fluorinase [Candidatus Eisenbacteria bacterium]